MSGAIRTLSYCTKSILDKIINPLKTKYNIFLFGDFWILDDDVSNLDFQMKWDRAESEYMLSINALNFNKYNIEQYKKEHEEIILNNCNGQYIIDEYKKIIKEDERTSFVNYAFNAMGMYYKIAKCHKLMNDYIDSNNIHIDYVIRMRPDFYWFDKIPLTLFDNITDNDIILVFDSYCKNANWKGNDKFFAGTKNVMDKYSNLYYHINEIYQKKIRVEGQNCAQEFIKILNLNIIFWGNENSYEKATGKFIKKRKLIPFS